MRLFLGTFLFYLPCAQIADEALEDAPKQKLGTAMAVDNWRNGFTSLLTNTSSSENMTVNRIVHEERRE